MGKLQLPRIQNGLFHLKRNDFIKNSINVLCAFCFKGKKTLALEGSEISFL